MNSDPQPQTSHPNSSRENPSGLQDSFRQLSLAIPPKTQSLEQVRQDREQRIDSTGNLLWPAEEILAYECLHPGGRVLQRAKQILITQQENPKSIQTFRVVELGSGYSGLAALCFLRGFLDAARHQASVHKQPVGKIFIEVFITDGNQTCAECNLDMLTPRPGKERNTERTYLRCLETS